MTHITLYYPSQHDLNLVKDTFRYRRNASMEFFMKPLRKCLLGHPLQVLKDGKEVPLPSFIEKAMQKSQIAKYDMHDFVAFMLADSRNVALYLNKLPLRERNLYDTILQIDHLNIIKAEKVLGTSLERVAQENAFWGGISNMQNMVFVSYESYSSRQSWSTNFFMHITPPLSKFFFLALHPEYLHPLEPVKELPEDLHIRCMETPSIVAMPIINALLSQAELINKTGKVSLAALKRTITQIGTEEFFEDQLNPKELLTMRRSLMLQSFALFRHHFNSYERKLKSAPMEQRLRVMYDRLLRYPLHFVTIILSHITGLRETNIQEGYYADITNHLVSALSNLRTGEWYSVEGLINKYVMATSKNHVLSFLSLYYLERSTIRNKFTGNEEPMTPDRIKEELGVPLFKGMLMCMAAWGLLDVGVSDYLEEDVSPYDGLEYVRLTPLGAYVLKMTEQYTPPEIEKHEVYFDLDPNRLILRSVVADNPYEGLLTDTCVHIGNSRYEMTAETFLAHCQNRSDVESKISFFKRYISGDLSEVWTQFFDSLLQRCNPLTAVNTQEYRIYQIAPTNRPLIRLLTNDPKLRKYIVRAENYLILVKTSDIVNFTSRLKALGYLM